MEKTFGAGMHLSGARRGHVMESKSLVVNEIPMRWEEAGEGFPLVLVHGIPTSPALWRYVVPRIRGARCLAWEMVGYGASIPQGRGREISVSRQADYLLAWMAAMDLEKAVLAGHDLGGGVVQIAAVRQPSRCAGLFLTNSIAYDSWPIPSVKAMQASAPLVRRLPDAAVEPALALLYVRGHDAQGEAKRARETHWRHYADHGGAEALVRQVEALDVRDTLAVADRLSGLDVPARVVWGDADRFQKADYGRRLARDLRCPFTAIEGGKHFTPEDHPEEIAAAIDDLVQEAAGTPGRSTRMPRDARLRRGHEVFRRYDEVTARSASEKVREVFEDVQATLRVPFVNLLFRMLANDPDYLIAAWRSVRPLARTRGFEEHARRLRERSLPEPREPLEIALPASEAERIRRFTHSIHYVLPKLLLIATFLDPEARASEASPRTPSGRDTEEIPFGVAEGMERIEMVDPEKADPRLRELFDRIQQVHGHPSVATYYRCLGHWPDLLRRLWVRLEPEIGRADYDARKRDVIRQAETTADAMRNSSPPPPDVDEDIAALLAVFRLQIIPDLLMDVSIATGLLGATGATAEPPSSRSR